VTQATDQHGISEGDMVTLTEKYDGTTVQATNKGVFKRKDNFQQGDRRKHASSEHERYSLERLNLEDDSSCSAGLNGYIKEAVKPYFAQFAQLEDGLCVYFEAIGTNIQSRFGLDLNGERWHDIRVFDFTFKGKFLPWQQTVQLAKKYNLPLVKYYEPQPLSYEKLVNQLK
jgi:hypothetical protein